VAVVDERYGIQTTQLLLYAPLIDVGVLGTKTVVSGVSNFKVPTSIFFFQA